MTGANVFMENNSSPVTITNFLSPYAGQMITIAFNDSNTTVQSNSNVRLQGNADFNGTSLDTLTLLNTNGMQWVEVTRSVN